MDQAPSEFRRSYALLPTTTAALGVVIFIADTITEVNVPIGVFYVAVVLMSARFCQARGVVLISTVCVGLTLLSYFLSHPPAAQWVGAIDLFVGVGAIGVITLLALQSQSAQQALRERASLLDLTHDTIFVRDTHDRITYWNRGAADLYGWVSDEAIGKSTHQLMKTTFPAPLEEINAELIRSGRWEGELLHAKRDETRVVVASRWALQRNEQGSPISILETNNDITERRRAEDGLRESEEKWRTVFEHNPTMYFMVDPGGTTLSVNPFGAEQLGYSVDELVGASVLNTVHEADQRTMQENTARCIEHGGQTMTWELRKRRKDGSILWVRETARAMMTKGHAVVLIACEDITERKRAENLTGQVFESSPDAISIVGPDYRFQRANPVCAKDWRMPIERIVGKRVADLVGASVFDQTIKPCLDRCFRGEEVNHAEWFVNPHGRRYLAMTYSPLWLGSEHVEAALLVSRDLTDHVLASEALRATQAELAHVNRVTTMGQLTASIAHEVNQPIAAAVTNAQAALRWLGAQPPEVDEVRQALERIVANGGRASDVIGRIRGLIKKTPARKVRFDLNEAVIDVIALTRTEVLKHGVSLQTRFGTSLPSVDGDRVQLQQVLLNLIMNAVEAMSSVTEGARELEVSTTTEAAGDVLVTVRDSGPGLDPTSVDRLFDAFYTTKSEGMGMGLAICRSIIEAHGGRLWATANEPAGAVFQFVLPPDRGDSAPAEHAGRRSAA